MSRSCYVMRGLPGAGKDHWIGSTMFQNRLLVCSADDYFMNEKSGDYEFDKTKLPAAHDYCIRKFLRAVFRNESVVVVNNTNVRLWEIAPYYRAAEAFGYSVEIVWVHCHPTVAAKRCVHGVPVDIVEGMARSFDPLPPHWKVRHIYGG